ncbi:MAG: hypothetical protein RL372_431 [Bacteroidota bacterium]|jgi:hypothetical protein
MVDLYHLFLYQIYTFFKSFNLLCIYFRNQKTIIYLHKILPIFLLHIMLVIILILIGLIKNKKKLIYISIGLVYSISTPIFSNNFFKLVEVSEYRKPISAIDSADALGF